MKHKYFFLMLFVGLFCLVNNAFTETAFHWKNAGWYGGGCYPYIEFDQHVKNRVYLVSDVSGVWRSNDLGENWYFVTKGLGDVKGVSLAIAPSDSNIIYAATDRGFFVSRDAANTWQACGAHDKDISFKRPNDYRCITVSPNDSAKVYIGTAKGAVLYSSDYGKGWNFLGDLKKPFENILITAMALSKDGDFLFVSCVKGMARYSLKDKNWVTLETAPQEITDFLLTSKNIIYAAAGKALAISRDLGKTWEYSSSIPQGKALRVDVVDSTGMIYIAWHDGWKGGILTTKDEGKSWQDISKNMHGDIALNPARVWLGDKTGRPTAVVVDPFDPAVVFRADWASVWRSDDGGNSWFEKVNAAPNVVGSDIIIDAKDNIYVATMDNGLLKSSDSGKSYKALFPKHGYDKSINGHVWRVVAWDNNVVATSSPWNENINQVIVSSDGGENFTIVRDGLPQKRPKVNTMWEAGYPRALAIDPKNHDRIYLGIDGDDGGGLFISDNGGKNWLRSVGQPGSLRIYNGLAVDPTDTNRIFWGACGKGGGVYLSNDQGKTWQRVCSAIQWVIDIAIAKDGTIYAAGDAGGPALYVSHDHGQVWKLLKKFNVGKSTDAICIDPNNVNRIAVSTVAWSGAAEGRIYFSADAGKSWKDITGDLPDGAGAAAMTFSNDGQYLYMNRYAGTVYRIKLQ